MGSGTNSTDWSTVAQQSVSSVLTSYAASAVAKFGLGTNYKGRMGARGAQQEAAKVAAYQYRQQLMQEKVSAAQQEFAQTNPFEPGALFTSVENAPASLVVAQTKALNKLTALNAKTQTKRVLVKERKLGNRLANLENKAAPYTNVRVGELYGANAGYWRERGAPAPLWLTQGSH